MNAPGSEWERGFNLPLKLLIFTVRLPHFSLFWGTRVYISLRFTSRGALIINTRCRRTRLKELYNVKVKKVIRAVGGGISVWITVRHKMKDVKEKKKKKKVERRVFTFQRFSLFQWRAFYVR